MQHTPTDSLLATQPAVGPLFRFFLRSRVGKGQLLMAIMFVATMAFLSYYSDQLGGAVELRMVVYWLMAMVLWPIWLADDDFKPGGAVRLLVTPRHRMHSVIFAYILARNAFAVLVAVFSSLVLFNVEIGEAGLQAVLRTIAASTGMCLVIVNIANYWGMMVRGKRIILMIFISLFAIWRLEVVFDGGMLAVIASVLGPMWLPDAGIELFQSESMVNLYQVVTASAFWGWLTLREFTRQYRTIDFFGRTSV